MHDGHDNCGFGLIAHTQGQESHRLIRLAMQGLGRLQHRGGVAADGKTGDGCGLLMRMPVDFFRTLAAEQDWRLSRRFAVGMLFLPLDNDQAAQVRTLMEKELEVETLSVSGWRTVPVDESVLGPIAHGCRPRIEQVLVNAPPGWRKRELERRLFMARRRLEKRLVEAGLDAYVASLSCVVIVYKALVLAADLPRFYPDLADMRLTTSICLFHQRFSTNTLPRWPLAQPFRYLAHNGEINTIAGNRHWAKARAYKLASPLLPDLPQIRPFISEDGSDSQSMDNMLELLLAGGMDLFRAMRLIMPPAWEQDGALSDERKAFFEFNSMHMEPWDGPAGVVMCDGRIAACQLDRNGLRPARWVQTDDGLFTLASEVGIWDYADDEVVAKGRVGPGQLLAVDTYNGKIWHSDAIDDELGTRHPYRDWLDQSHQELVPFEALPSSQAGQRGLSDDQLRRYQKHFGLSREELFEVLLVLGRDGKEPIGSMGDDTPLAVLSSQPRSLFDYFRQRFAQVTNPPMDSLREAFVMSLTTCIGREHNVFCETTSLGRRVQFGSPVLLYSDLRQLQSLDQAHFKSQMLSLAFADDQPMDQAIIALCDQAERAARQGAVLLVLSDRHIGQSSLQIPAPLAVGAVQKRLVEKDLRCDTNILVESATVRDAHHFAVLLGLGATAIYPYLAFESLAALADAGHLEGDAKSVLLNYRNGINLGLSKILSKMGISTVSSYRGSALFDQLGLAHDISELCFPRLTSPIGGDGFETLCAQQRQLRDQATLPGPLPLGGQLKFVPGGEFHAWQPQAVQLLQEAVRSPSQEAWQRYSDQVHTRPATYLRDLLSIHSDRQPIALDQVEPAEQLFPRFDTAAMSIGALSPEAHQALALAMNALGGRSNSGEGGEAPARRRSPARSKIRQIASGRFGVTPEYLATAEVLQIKMAQGAKPGEGGQLPGHKVTAEIAALRHATVGTTLISPPPHHDIYSIEDLAQLIYDLKAVNPRAQISVKLVAVQGVGTIACGVVKAGADHITLSGYDGGTGASPLSSIKYAGSPWELGLAESHQALIREGLRDQVQLQVDGGFKTGQDVIKAALLGADSFGFGTAPMVALGCRYLRICHLNNCATGVATQNDQLRRDHFHGVAEQVQHFFQLLAEEVRQQLAALGVATLAELRDKAHWLQAQGPLDLSRLSQQAQAPAFTTVRQRPDLGLNATIQADANQAGATSQPWLAHYPIQNTDRAVPAALAGQLALDHGDGGSPQPIHLHFRGQAGQSFGAFLVPGMEVRLFGDANDYVAKGMAGGTLVLQPPGGSRFAAHESLIMGNTCLFGATGGQLYAAGQAGERFAVRNSGATAVVEGLGDHGCEYMTAGLVMVLGPTGRNFGAGMTGGLALVLDLDPVCLSSDPLSVCAAGEHAQAASLIHRLLGRHQQLSQSALAAQLLDDWPASLARFSLVAPKGQSISQCLPSAEEVV